MRRSRASLAFVLLIAVVGLVLGISPADAQGKGNGKGKGAATSTIEWAPADEAAITPGAEMVTNGAQCTANFIFTDGADVLVGYAAHCAGDGGAATDTDGCLAPSLPTDGSTQVEIEGASQPGTLVYSSWETMQRVDETDPDTCLYNDFALVRIHPADHDAVNPSIPHWGGPTGLDTDGTGAGETVYGYGNSSLRLGIRALSPKAGVGLGTTAGGWTHPVYTVSPGIPGDSGSALLDADGAAAGVLSTLALAPLPGSNNYSDLASALEYMRGKGGPAATLALGTEAFDGAQLPLDLGCRRSASPRCAEGAPIHSPTAWASSIASSEPVKASASGRSRGSSPRSTPSSPRTRRCRTTSSSTRRCCSASGSRPARTSTTSCSRPSRSAARVPSGSSASATSMSS